MINEISIIRFNAGQALNICFSRENINTNEGLLVITVVLSEFAVLISWIHPSFLDFISPLKLTGHI